jgi:hypothetical protein
MKSMRQSTYLPALLGLLLLSACGKETETTAPVQESESPTATAPVASQVQEAVSSIQEVTEPAKQAAQSAATQMEEAKETVATAVDSEKENALQIIQSVKELIGQAKYTEALAALSTLSIDQLSPELQGLATQLKGKAEEALASTAAGKAGETISNVLKENNIQIENPFKK